MEDGCAALPFSRHAFSRHVHRSFRRRARGQESGAEDFTGYSDSPAQFLDFLWPVFVLLCIEHVRIAPGSTRVSPLDFTDYPISHSLLIATVWAVLFCGAYYTLRRNARSALVLGAALLSHWLLDFIVHRPDLQLYPGSEARVGLGLSNSWADSIAMEVLFFGAGLGIYLSCTRARDNAGRHAFWPLMHFSSLAG